jgi:hypothetical protein
MRWLFLWSVFASSVLLSALTWSDTTEAAQLRLTWTDRSHNEDGFHIERKTGNSGTFALIAVTAANVSSYTDSGVTAGITYCYRVRAFNRTSLSAYTNAVCATPLYSLRNNVDISPLAGANPQASTPGILSPPETSTTPLSSPPLPRLAVQLGLFRPATGGWYLDRNGNGLWDGCQDDGCFGPFGQSGDLPVVGDWTGTGRSGIGVVTPLTGLWQLDRNSNGMWDGCEVDLCFESGEPAHSLPLLGDWTGSGTMSSGTFDAQSGLWQLDGNNDGVIEDCHTDLCLGPFGRPGDLPVVADWTGTGTTKIGVFDPKTGLWELDLNGNGVWDGCQDDGCFGPFGQSGDLPVAVP